MSEKLKKYFIDFTNFLQSTQSPHFPLGGKVGQLSKKKRVLWWSIYIICIWPEQSSRCSQHPVQPADPVPNECCPSLVTRCSRSPRVGWCRGWVAWAPFDPAGASLSPAASWCAWPRTWPLNRGGDRRPAGCGRRGPTAGWHYSGWWIECAGCSHSWWGQTVSLSPPQCPRQIRFLQQKGNCAQNPYMLKYSWK